MHFRLNVHFTILDAGNKFGPAISLLAPNEGPGSCPTTRKELQFQKVSQIVTASALLGRVGEHAKNLFTQIAANETSWARSRDLTARFLQVDPNRRLSTVSSG